MKPIPRFFSKTAGLLRLFIADLDGTLLDADATLNGAARERLTRLMANGVAFSVATSRAYPSIMEILGDVPLRLPIIEQNGAIIREPHTGRLIDYVPIPPNDVDKVLQVFADRGLDPFVSAMGDDQSNPLLFRRLDNAGMHWYVNEKRLRGDLRPTEVEDYDRCRATSVVTITYLGAEDTLAELQTAVCSCAELTVLRSQNNYTGDYEIGIAAAGTDKGHALRRLRRLLDCAIELVVFGDGTNDIPMFREADVAVAMSHASPELKRLAHCIVEGDSAVVQFLERYA